MNTLTIENLKEIGARYDINHFRWSKRKNALLPLTYYRMTNSQSDIEARGGLTTVHVRMPNGKTYYSVAECMKTDSFRNSLGVSIALKRIQEQIGEFDKVPFK